MSQTTMRAAVWFCVAIVASVLWRILFVAAGAGAILSLALGAVITVQRLPTADIPPALRTTMQAAAVGSAVSLFATAGCLTLAVCGGRAMVAPPPRGDATRAAPL